MKILLFFGNGSFIDSFGGAERVACNMANEFVQRGHAITIVCNDIKGGTAAYPLDERVRLINLNGTGKKIFQLTKKEKWYRELIRPLRFFYPPLLKDHFDILIWRTALKPLRQILEQEQADVIIPFFCTDSVLLAQCGFDRPTPRVQMLHDSPKHIKLGNRNVRRAIQKCDTVQVLLPEFKEDLRRHYKGNIVVIPNVISPSLYHTEYRDSEKGRIIHIGRLDVKQKRQHLLINAFAKVAGDFPNWTLHFFGNETTRGYHKYLTKLILKYNLQKRIFLEGATQTPDLKLANSDIFAFPSSHEGFSLALLEAMAVGLPCLGFKTTASVKDLIQDEKNGLLVDETPVAFANGLRQLMSNPELRKRLGEAGREFAKQYEPKVIWDSWEKLLSQVVADANPCKDKTNKEGML
ncbi:MAG: glycosyltransferase [Planctomycetia bacterium]|nr:glycosyltransferase [Planctomycetia bacterium]